MVIGLVIAIVIGFFAAILGGLALVQLFRLRSTVERDRMQVFEFARRFGPRFDAVFQRFDSLIDVQRLAVAHLGDVHTGVVQIRDAHQLVAGNLRTVAKHLGELSRTTTEYVEVTTAVDESEYAESPEDEAPPVDSTPSPPTKP